MAVGRPRTFDIDEALENALYVFWEKGYEGTSLPDLTEAMGINRPSLYAAFGNKEELFRKALDRYAEKITGFMQEKLSAPTAYEGVESLLRTMADGHCSKSQPRGCLLVQGALSCGEEAEPIKHELAARRAEIEQTLSKRFARARLEGDLPQAINSEDLARYFATLMHGMAVQAASGATPQTMHGIVDVALRAWPR
ncbi:MAG: TetR/AcrR family transcriptional regulator [Rickettsiales bacterium]